jgi:hypothetical protein
LFLLQSNLYLSVAAWMFSWLSSFKLLAMVLGTGSLAEVDNSIVFAASLALPVAQAPKHQRCPPWCHRISGLLLKLAISMLGTVLVCAPMIRGILDRRWAPNVVIDITVHSTPNTIYHT